MPCFICSNPFILDEHHIVPQFGGGKEGPTVDLCPNCHSGIHRSALQALSKKPKSRTYFTEDQLVRAQPLIKFIIIYYRKVQSHPDMKQTMNLVLKPNRQLLTLLHLVKSDAGFSNLNDFCLYVLGNYLRGRI